MLHPGATGSIKAFMPSGCFLTYILWKTYEGDHLKVFFIFRWQVVSNAEKVASDALRILKMSLFAQKIGNIKNEID